MIRVISIYKIINKRTGITLHLNLEVFIKEGFAKGFEPSFNTDISNPLTLTDSDLVGIGQFNKPKDNEVFRFQHLETRVVSFDDGLISVTKDFLLNFNDGDIPDIDDSNFSHLTNAWLDVYKYKYTRQEFHWALMQIEFFS